MSRLIIFCFMLTALFALDVQKIYQESYRFEKMQDYKDAIKVLKPLLHKDPNNYILNLRLAWLSFQSKAYKDAVEYYQRASILRPKSFEPKLGLARLFLQIGKYDKAFDISNTILKQDYYNYYANYYAGAAMLAIQPKKSKEIAMKMLELYPSDRLFLKLLAKSLQSEDLQKAIEIYKRIIVLYPTDVEAQEFCSAHCGSG